MNYERAYSPPCEGGVSAPSKNGSVPKTARTGWSLTSYLSKCVLKHWLVSDHPVCGATGERLTSAIRKTSLDVYRNGKLRRSDRNGRRPGIHRRNELRQ